MMNICYFIHKITYLIFLYNFEPVTRVSVWNNKRTSSSSPYVVYIFTMSYPNFDKNEYVSKNTDLILSIDLTV